MTAAGGRRRDVLDTLRNAGEPLTIAAIADQLGVHVNTVRFHLDSLLEAGQVHRADAPRDKPGRPPQLFAATEGMDPGGPRHYRLLAEALAESLARTANSGAAARAAGRALGAQLAKARPGPAGSAPVDRLVDLLDELGFDPSPSGARIDLRHCPFLEAAKAHPEVVCPVHLGLMQGATTAWQLPISVRKLTPFVEPDRCVALTSGVSA